MAQEALSDVYVLGVYVFLNTVHCRKNLEFYIVYRLHFIQYQILCCSIEPVFCNTCLTLILCKEFSFPRIPGFVS